MDKIVIQGGRRLQGRIRASGAKNAALPLIFASILTDRPCRLTDVPEVADIHTACRLLEMLGAVVQRPAAGELSIDCSGVSELEAPYELVRTMRASFLTLGPLLARFGRARVSKPGGCAIGSRPVDIHLEGFRAMGARVDNVRGYADVSAERLRGQRVILEKPSVGATENLVMAACLADGETRIENCAREPEVVDLIVALTSMGAKITGAGSSVIEVEGVSSLGAMDHRVMPDRIEVGTFLIAGAMTRGDIFIERGRPQHLGALIDALEASGSTVRADDDGIGLFAETRPLAISVETAPYPGFPTDLQAQLMAMMALASGTSRISETIFENRFMHVGELQRMGASIKLSGNNAEVHGQVSLKGAQVMATDLRASVCLVLAGLAAQDQTEVFRVYHLDRGYENREGKLAALGARITRETA
jgi:UDP-N-acetylglucosamine 1-carboxyvinyltransferase